MNESQAVAYTKFALPAGVVSRGDVSRLASEVEQVDNQLTAIAARMRTGSQATAMPVLSGPLSEFLAQNSLTLKDGQTRSALIRQLRLLKDKAPVVHMTFATEADQQSLQELVAWIRSSVHSQAVISVGLQPSLVAGVYIRTPNRVYDFSLRQVLQGRRDQLVKALGVLRAGG